MKGAWPILFLAAGFSVWAAVFLLLYGMQALGCRLAWDRVALVGPLSLQTFIQIVLYLTALAGMAATWWWLRRRARKAEHDTTTHEFLIKVSDHAALAALGAVVFCFAGVFWLSAC